MVESIKDKGNSEQIKMAQGLEKSSNESREERLLLPPASILAGVMKAVGDTGEGMTRFVYTAKNKSSLPGSLYRSEDSGIPKRPDDTASLIYDHLGSTYKLFKNIYERDSLDGNGMPLRATVHYRRKYNNAFWNGAQMVFGDGDGKLFDNFNSLSVVSHELSHGVVHFSGGLQYRNQSGALNEHVADVFGVLAEQYLHKQRASEAHWLIGRGILSKHVNGTALRSMIAPGTAYNDPVLGKDPQPYHMKDFLQTTWDNGGVHVNSGIPNHAFYLVSNFMGGYAWEKAGKIWYETLQRNHNSMIDFKQWAELTVEVAGDMFGNGSVDQQHVKRAWNLVGVF
jgi:Zn-dependent metalloprotease